MAFPNRIKAIGSMIPNGSMIVDVGADHGLLEKYVLLKKKNCYIQAVENKLGPFRILLDNLSGFKNIEIHRCDGLAQCDSLYDTYVLAGLGGDTILNILGRYEQKVRKVKRIIIDAHTYIPKVRREIIKYGLNIKKEKIVFEGGKYYIVISFERNNEVINYTEDELDFGYNIMNDKLFPKYKKHLLHSYKITVGKIKNAPEKSEQLKKLIKRLEAYGKDEII